MSLFKGASSDVRLAYDDSKRRPAVAEHTVDDRDPA